MYLEGNEIQRNIPNAIKYFDMAAKQGDADSSINLGFIYSEGIDVKKDKQKAFQYYEEAIKQGDLSGITHYNLGTFYEDGDYVHQDKRKALELYRTSANLGVGRAKEKVKQLESNKK